MFSNIERIQHFVKIHIHILPYAFEHIFREHSGWIRHGDLDTVKQTFLMFVTESNFKHIKFEGYCILLMTINFNFDSYKFLSKGHHKAQMGLPIPFLSKTTFFFPKSRKDVNFDSHVK